MHARPGQPVLICPPASSPARAVDRFLPRDHSTHPVRLVLRIGEIKNQQKGVVDCLQLRSLHLVIKFGLDGDASPICKPERNVDLRDALTLDSHDRSTCEVAASPALQKQKEPHRGTTDFCRRRTCEHRVTRKDRRFHTVPLAATWRMKPSRSRRNARRRSLQADGRHWLDAWRDDHRRWQSDVTDSNAQNLIRWGKMSSYLEPLRAAGLDEFVQELMTGKTKPAEAAVAFIRGAAQTSLRERRSAEGLSIFDTTLRDGEIDYFVASAKSLREEQTKARPAALLEKRPFKANALRGDVGELRRSLDRKRGGTTFRNLMERYGEHILAATPVVFVSPASLAQFVPPGSATFDLVVFDEASQVTVPQAIGALGRGRSAVIVGDSQQMPPTSVGKVSINDDEEAFTDGNVVPDDLESILTECVDSGVPRLWLSWHYRSQDESLINFSNQQYYEGRLASLPSPGNDPTAGVEWLRVDGHFNREDTKHHHRTNRIEAEAIVTEIRHRLSTPRLAGQSIGVVTFNQQQQTLVQDLLEESGDRLVLDRLRADAEEPIFVKNLENVQGDERDVILFTTAFSKKPGDPKLPLNFGPLTAVGGEKRFNVAITRARRKVVVFTSFAPSDIDLTRTRSTGLAHLRAYLEMAGEGINPVSSAEAKDDGGDVVQQTIAAALRDRGYEVDLSFGLSDFVLNIVVREPSSERWQVALMLDGPAWAERPTVADRDLTPQLLEPMMHWGAALRIWLPEWIDSPDSVLDRVDSAVERAKQRQREIDEKLDAEARARAAEIAETKKSEHANDSDDPEDESANHVELQWASQTSDPPAESVSLVVEHEQPVSQVAGIAFSDADTNVGRRDWSGAPALYVLAPTTTLGPREDLDRTNSTTVRNTITQAVREIVAAEGPIELDRLARYIGTRFGYGRVSAIRKDFILGCVPETLVHKSKLGRFAWPSELDAQEWRGYRSTPTDTTRPLSEIAPEEVINAMAVACRGRSLEDETLIRETLGLFSQRRLTEQAQDRLAACIELAVNSGRLLRIDGAIRAGA